MGISKVWLEEQISKLKESTGNSDILQANIEGQIFAFEACYNELIQPPQPKKLTKIDHEKGFEAIVRYYIDKKNYTPEHANEIAIKAIGEQKQKVLDNS